MFTSNRRINKCCRISSVTCVRQILFPRKHSEKNSCSVYRFQRDVQGVIYIFKVVNDNFTAEDVSLAICVGICIDRAAALRGHNKGFQTEVQQSDPHVNFYVASFVERR